MKKTFLLVVAFIIAGCASVYTPRPTHFNSPEMTKIALDIQTKVSSNWIVPPAALVTPLTKPITVHLILTEKGMLSSIQVVQSSGVEWLDGSLLRAIQKSIPLPIPADQLAQFRDIELTFSPAP